MSIDCVCILDDDGGGNTIALNGIAFSHEALSNSKRSACCMCISSVVYHQKRLIFASYTLLLFPVIESMHPPYQVEAVAISRKIIVLDGDFKHYSTLKLYIARSSSKLNESVDIFHTCTYWMFAYEWLQLCLTEKVVYDKSILSGK